MAQILEIHFILLSLLLLSVTVQGKTPMDLAETLFTILLLKNFTSISEYLRKCNLLVLNIVRAQVGSSSHRK